MELEVLVCDIMLDHAEIQKVKLGDIEQCKTYHLEPERKLMRR
jgi:hypothetical protein